MPSSDRNAVLNKRYRWRYINIIGIGISNSHPCMSWEREEEFPKFLRIQSHTKARRLYHQLQTVSMCIIPNVCFLILVLPQADLRGEPTLPTVIMWYRHCSESKLCVCHFIRVFFSRFHSVPGAVRWYAIGCFSMIRAVIYFTLLLQFIFQLRTIAKQQLQNNETNLVGAVKLDYLWSTLQISWLRLVVASESDHFVIPNKYLSKC